ncbi:MAG: site-specific DNA-methyltransferase [Phycisphaerales bacterium]|nr:site-specific DNA-methyltransferase [Phycisphaerae bacterium]NNF42252.1 site-specific DNA-methyltransferase [Phycisphaerales bacterium]NNM25659.1 site-specific DNA-methyltransferase [Phycisphaerales bacterium]
MAERKNTDFDRPGGYAQPSGATASQRKAADDLTAADIRLYGDGAPSHVATRQERLTPAFSTGDPETLVYVGDCRDVLANMPERGSVDLVFADPPFNWDVPYDEWHDGMPRAEYERFTFDWLDGCIEALAPHGSLFVNIPDDTAAEVVVHLKRRGLTMINWCVWHFRFGQNRDSSFIMSKVHVLYFAKDPSNRRWNPDAILEPSDRASVYFDPRTMAKDAKKGMRVPMDVWYGQYWGRIQGNNKERRHHHHNQIPEAYLERVILAASNEGDLVLDPFLGSGTTGTVARAWNRRSIGIEYAQSNAESAWNRIVDVGMIRKGASLGKSSAIVGQKRSKPKSFERMETAAGETP